MLGTMAAGVSVFGAWRWKRATQALVEHLNEGGAKAANLRYNADSITGLPCPVQRYFRTVLTDGQPIIQSADIRMDGMFNLSLERPRWRPFTSRQRVVTDRPGFVWDARVMVLPGVPVFVHDAYVAGMGILCPTIFGLVPLGAIKGIWGKWIDLRDPRFCQWRAGQPDDCDDAVARQVPRLSPGEWHDDTISGRGQLDNTARRTAIFQGGHKTGDAQFPLRKTGPHPVTCPSPTTI